MCCLALNPARTFFKISLSYFMCEGLPTCVYEYHVYVPSTQPGQERAPVLLELGLQSVESDHMVAGNSTLVLCKSS